MMNEFNTRKQDGDESFDLTEWLTNDVKLPQYADAFLRNGFESPIECSSIDETALDTLGVTKIGHRRRLLVSCQKLAAKWGLIASEDLAKREQSSKTSSEAKGQETFPDNVQSLENLELPPLLPPKKGKKTRPSPPPRNMAEQEINIDCAIEGENSNVVSHDDLSLELSNASNPEPNLPEFKEVKPVESTKDGGSTIHESTNSETSSSPARLSSDNEFSGYEPMWQAREGEPLPLSFVEPTNETSESQVAPVDNNGNVDVNKAEENSIHSEIKIAEKNINNDDLQIKQINGDVKQPGGNVDVLGPPPIPPRADLEEVVDYVNVSSTSKNIATPETNEPNSALLESKPSDLASQKKTVVPKRKAPMKPPRRYKPPPVSMVIPSDTTVLVPARRSLGSIDQAVQDHNDDNEVFTKPFPEDKFEEKPKVVDEKRPTAVVPDINDDNIYGNANNFQKNPPLQSILNANIPPESDKNRKPIPVPRSRTLSGKQKVDNVNNVYDTVQAKSDNQPTQPKQGAQFIKLSTTDTGTDGGSCTEDDLSGSDKEEMPEPAAGRPIPSEYETVNFRPSKTASMIQARYARKEGYLFKQGGQQNNKGWKKRWVVFDGNELSYYKDKDHTNESLQLVPVAIMREVRIVTEDVKRARFDLACAGRTYMFALGIEDMDDITLWAQILMNAIIQVRKEDETSVSQAPGGEMFDPDKEGFLKKQGNNVVVDWKKRYVAVKDGKLAYYHNYEDFILASPINTIEMNIASVKVDPKSPNRFQLVTPHRTYLFQCEDERELRSWIAAQEKAIQLALSDRRVINKIWENPSNRRCADCGDKDPLWASVNLVVCVCAWCIGIHRKLGVHSSKARSLLMDEKIWSPSLIKLMVQVGNEISNKFWQYKIPDDDKISPESTSESREEFIRKKYVQRLYRRVSPLYGDRKALGEALKQAVRENDIEKTMQLVFCDADVKYISSDGSDSRTPYELAKEANHELQMEFLAQNGATAEEPESVHSPGPTSPMCDNTYETVGDNTYETVRSPSFHQTSSISIIYEKEGFLLKRAPNAAVWRRRNFMLKGRDLWYDKGDREGYGWIKLKDVDEYIYNDSLTLDIVTAERTYNLKAETKEEALSWYTALRNKQVFQVPLQCQELGSDGIPHLVAKSLQFVETHGIEAEGIYRKNGNKAKIRMLKKLFNQDAESVMIFREEYEAHDVAGLLKEYFRELPDPLMTEDAYAHFITASLAPKHDDKLHMYKDSLGRLPEVNRTTLKAVINHLVRVSSKSQQNKMKLENISLIFGPTLMSNDQMGSMDTNTINQEFTVIGDFINYYKWLFDVGDDEVLKDKKIAEAMNKLSQLNAFQSNLREVEHMTLDIYVFSTDNECSRITVYKDTKASEVCQELTSKRALPPDLNWALFQDVNKEIERPFPATEKVLATVIETGKYSKDSHLVVRENYIQQKLEAYALQNDVSQSIAGSCQTMKETKKKENWKKLFVKLEKGALTVHKTLKSKDEIDSWPLKETTLYIGVDRDKKPLTGFGFTIVRIVKDGHSKDGNCVCRYICLEDERDLFRWINIFLKLKYPEIDDLWNDPKLEPIGYYAEPLPPSNPPRQRTPSNRMQVGVPANMLNELKEKQLRKSIRK